MSFVVPNISEVSLLKIIVGKLANGNLKVHLFTNDLVPDENTTAPGTGGGPTESVAAGYAAITTAASEWTVVTDLSGASSAVHSGATFTFTEADTIYGYYITLGTEMLLIERFSDGAVELPSEGGVYTVTATMNLD